MNMISSSRRLYSLDALRGFDMFWIIGAEDVFHQMASASNTPWWIGISKQFEHPYWNGFTAYDLIFPLFIFVTGISATFSLGSALEKGTDKKALMWKVLKRGCILLLLGMIYNNGLQLRPLDEFRFMSVLGRIGIAYMFSSIIFLYASNRFQYIWFAGLLIGYWLILKFNSAPGFPIGDLSESGNFASYLDRTVLPGKLSRGIHDTVGLFNNLAAISSGLAGILTGTYLQRQDVGETKKTLTMAGFGIAAICIAQVWNLEFPINKNLWSSSFVLQTTGFSLILMSVFYFIIDVKKHQRWAFFFKVIGMNSILIYMSGKVINWGYANKGLFQWLDDLIGDPYNAVAMACTAILIKWIFLYFLYKKSIFLKI